MHEMIFAFCVSATAEASASLAKRFEGVSKNQRILSCSELVFWVLCAPLDFQQSGGTAPVHRKSSSLFLENRRCHSEYGCVIVLPRLRCCVGGAHAQFLVPEFLHLCINQFSSSLSCINSARVAMVC